jgi:hypothetical protein
LDSKYPGRDVWRVGVFGGLAFDVDVSGTTKLAVLGT